METWGDKPKSQVDASTVDEQIAADIQDHLDDPDAHLESGQSLQSHKASEIIDHLARSIVTDKLAEGCVTPFETDFGDIVIRPTFESLDAWGQTKQGNGADVIISPGQCQLVVGDAIGNKTIIFIEGFIDSLAYDDHAWFVVYLSLEPCIDLSDVAFGMGAMDPFNATDFFGFFFDQSAGKLYARLINSSSTTDTEIVGADTSGYHVYKAEMTDGGDTFKFYIDGVLKVTLSNQNSSMDTDYHFAVGLKADSAYSGGEQVFLSNLTIVEI